MSTRVSPTEKLRAEIDDLFGESEQQRQLAQARSARGEGRLLGDLLRHRGRFGHCRPGRGSPAGQTFATKWLPLYRFAVECLGDDFEHLITYLRFPKEHWKPIRHSNFIVRPPPSIFAASRCRRQPKRRLIRRRGQAGSGSQINSSDPCVADVWAGASSTLSV